MADNKHKLNEVIVTDNKEAFGESFTHSSISPPTQPPEPNTNTSKQQDKK